MKIHVLSVIPEFWSSISEITSPLASDICKTMYLMQSCKSSLDPSPILKSLKNKFHSAGQTSFNVFAQQDVVEVMEKVLEVIAVSSTLGNDSFNIRSSTTISCLTCHQDNVLEDNIPILSIPIFQNTSASLQKILECESLPLANAPICHVCSCQRESLSKLCFSNLGSVLIIQP